MKPLRVALCQVDGRVGDLEGNADRIRAAVREAAARGASLAVLPELALVGYPPRDLLLDEGFVAAVEEAAASLAASLPPGVTALVGSVAPGGPRRPGHPGLHDVALWLRGGRVEAATAKRLLPSYDVFHETRWYVPGGRGPVRDVAGVGVGALVCEDLWDEGYDVSPAGDLLADGAALLACLSASPYRRGILARRLAVARRHRAPLVYVNAAGANDELVFDGGSFALDGEGRLVARLPRHEEAVEVVELGAPAAAVEEGEDEAAVTFDALVAGIRGFARKNGLRRAFLGLSGGVDSALVACLAAEALGPKAVTALALPSRHSDPRSTEDARALAKALGIGFAVVPLEPLHAAAEALLAPALDPRGEDAAAAGVAAENVQARLRMVALMAHVNRHGGVLLNTSNKTELALGYGTLYGDLAGTLLPLGDLSKPAVYELLRRYDRGRGIVPPYVLSRPPSAELAPGQVDPFDYPVVAPIVDALVEGRPPPATADPALVADLARRLRGAEHKRHQAGIVLKVSDRAFGSGRLIPVTCRLR